MDTDGNSGSALRTLSELWYYFFNPFFRWTRILHCRGLGAETTCRRLSKQKKKKEKEEKKGKKGKKTQGRRGGEEEEAFPDLLFAVFFSSLFFFFLFAPDVGPAGLAYNGIARLGDDAIVVSDIFNSPRGLVRLQRDAASGDLAESATQLPSVFRLDNLFVAADGAVWGGAVTNFVSTFKVSLSIQKRALPRQP
jgi:hypothetical protein